MELKKNLGVIDTSFDLMAPNEKYLSRLGRKCLARDVCLGSVLMLADDLLAFNFFK